MASTSALYNNHHGAAYAWGEDSEQLLTEQSTHREPTAKLSCHTDLELNPKSTGISNLSYHDEGEEDAGVTELKKLVSKREKQTSKLLRKWGQFHGQMETNHIKTKSEIEQRKEELIRLINQQADEAQANLNEKFDSQYVFVKQQKQILEQRLDKLETFLPQRETVNNAMLRKYKKRLAEICKESDSEAVSHIPVWQQVTLDFSESLDFKEVFGEICGGPIQSEACYEYKGDVDHSEKYGGDNMLLSKPEMQHSFNIKTSKDSRDIGVCDLAVNNKGQIIIVDKHNKLVKVYDSSGRFQHFIGRHQIKEPSRVSVLEPSDMILVTDNHSKTIKLFQDDGLLLGTFVDDIKYPSSHCMSPDGRSIAVVEFSSGTIIIYDMDGQQQMSFPSGLDNPAFICSTQSDGQGRYIITDWKHHKLVVYSQTGKQIHCIEEKGSGPGQLDQPQAVTSDPHGHIIVADHNNHRVQIFNQDCQFLMMFDNSSDKPAPVSSTQYIKPLSASQHAGMQLPTALAYHPTGMLITCDYKGRVRTFKYLNQDLVQDESKRNKSKYQQKGKLRSHHRSLTEQEEAETIC